MKSPEMSSNLRLLFGLLSRNNVTPHVKYFVAIIDDTYSYHYMLTMSYEVNDSLIQANNITVVRRK